MKIFIVIFIILFFIGCYSVFRDKKQTSNPTITFKQFLELKQAYDEKNLSYYLYYDSVMFKRYALDFKNIIEKRKYKKWHKKQEEKEAAKELEAALQEVYGPIAPIPPWTQPQENYYDKMLQEIKKQYGENE